MALLGIIRRWHIRDQVPLREIARRLGISRNTVRRYLRSETVEPTYAERRSTRAIDKYAFQLSALLKTEAARSRKQRRTLKQIHEDLKELGFEGSYDRVAAFARTWREGQSERVNPASKRTPEGLGFAQFAPVHARTLMNVQASALGRANLDPVDNHAWREHDDRSEGSFGPQESRQPVAECICRIRDLETTSGCPS